MTSVCHPHTSTRWLAQGCTEADAQLERQDREAFVDFLLGVLDMDPATRWTPRQVLPKSCAARGRVQELIGSVPHGPVQSAFRFHMV